MSDNTFEELKTLIETFRSSHLSESAKKSFNRIDDHVRNRSIGIISANRKERKPAENRSNSKALEKDIRDAGYGFVRVKGGWVESQEDGSKTPVHEPSYIVVGHKGDDSGKLKQFMQHHGSKYDQDAVVYKQHDAPHVSTISTSDRDPESPRHSETNIGTYHPGKFGDYFTALHGDAYSKKSVKKMTPDEKKSHKEASLKQKAFVFESCVFEFSEDEDAPVQSVNELTLYGRMAATARTKKK
jgi:hypothetical protein